MFVRSVSADLTNTALMLEKEKLNASYRNELKSAKQTLTVFRCDALLALRVIPIYMSQLICLLFACLRSENGTYMYSRLILHQC